MNGLSNAISIIIALLVMILVSVNPAIKAALDTYGPWLLGLWVAWVAWVAWGGIYKFWSGYRVRVRQQQAEHIRLAQESQDAAIAQRQWDAVQQAEARRVARYEGESSGDWELRVFGERREHP